MGRKWSLNAQFEKKIYEVLETVSFRKLKKESKRMWYWNRKVILQLEILNKSQLHFVTEWKLASERLSELKENRILTITKLRKRN